MSRNGIFLGDLTNEWWFSCYSYPWILWWRSQPLIRVNHSTWHSFIWNWRRRFMCTM